MGEVHIGTSGYSYSHWKNLFYPAGLPQSQWLSFYADHFKTVEVNATFYRPFGPHVYEKWYNTTPKDFKYVLKGPLTITRLKRLKNAEEELGQFFTSTEPLREKFTVALWQMPPSFKYTEETYQDVERFFQALPTHVRHVIELRNMSWINDQFFVLLNQHKIGWVSADSSRFVSHTALTGSLGYIRLHGPGSLYSSPYSREQLESWAQIITNMQSEGEVYCFFNNDLGGHAVVDGAQLKQLLGFDNL